MKNRYRWTFLGVFGVLAASGGLLALSAMAQGPGPAAPSGGPQAAAPPAAESELAKYVTTSMSLALIESPDHATVWAFNGETGRWAKLSLRPGSAELPKLVKMEYALVEADDAIYGFSKQAGTWSALERKPGVKFAWIQRGEFVAVASMGTWVYAFSAKAGTWSGVDLLNP